MYLEELSDKVWKTKNARFVACRRMKRSRNSSTVSVALLSFSIIAINMLAFFNVGEKINSVISIVTVVLSTFALVMSLLISHLRYEFREDNYQQCGRELDNLNQLIQIKIRELCEGNTSMPGKESSLEDNLKYLNEYNAILAKFNLNHTDFDFKYSLLGTGESPIELLSLVKYKLRWYIFDANMLYWILAIVPIVGVVYAYVKIVPTIM